MPSCSSVTDQCPGLFCFQIRIYESVNFKEFVKLLSAFSSRASRDTKLEYMFLVYDVDGDGKTLVAFKEELDSAQVMNDSIHLKSMNLKSGTTGC